MLGRLLTRPHRLRSLTLTLAPPSHLPTPPLLYKYLTALSRSFSSDDRRGGGADNPGGAGGGDWNKSGSGGGAWSLTPDDADDYSLFPKEEPLTDAPASKLDDDGTGGEVWDRSEETEDPFAGILKEYKAEKGGIGGGSGEGEVWDRGEETVDPFDQILKDDKPERARGVGGEEESEPWSLGRGDEEEETGLFDGVGGGGIEDIDGEREEREKREEEKMALERREKELLKKLKGPDRAFGDIVQMSGITDDMICSLILMRDVRDVPGLPPLHVLEERAIAKQNTISSRFEIERKKQEEIAQARVRKVDEKGRAYGTGRRKCSIARVWIQCGDGKFTVNAKPFDSYFPMIDHRATLLEPFTTTNTLGLWDITSTVKGGGVSGQVGAIRLGISRALQNWEPGLRPYLKTAGFLTRDPRIVERKKPGKAKARKSFQWVKR